MHVPRDWAWNQSAHGAKKCFSPEVLDHVEPASSSADVKAAGSHGLKRPEGSPDDKIHVNV